MGQQDYSELEFFANTQPELYSVLKKIINNVRANTGIVIGGNGNPNNVVAGVPNQLYVEKGTSAAGVQNIWIKTGKPGTKTGWLQFHTQTPQSATALDYPNLFVDPAKTGFRATGSVPPASMSGFAYTATAVSVKWFWDGTNGSTLMKIQRADNQSFLLVGNQLIPQNVTGLTNTNTYAFYPYYDENLKLLKFVSSAGAVGTPAIAFPTAVPGGTDTLATTAQLITAAQLQSLRYRINLSNGGVKATAAGGGSGSGGGSPGANCFHHGMKLERDDGRLVTALDVRPQDSIRCRGGLTKIGAWSAFPCKDWIRLKFSNGTVHIVTERHLIATRGDALIQAREARLGALVESQNGGRVTIDEMTALHEDGTAICFHCQPEKFIWAGMETPNVLTHNAQKL